jgi:predicted O-methyltransferase YrrM
MLIPQPYRSLYEGHLHLPGQMWFEDRRVLYDTVRRVKPKSCFEVGTWLGGGSTLVVARALQKNGFGHLHTIETDEWAYPRAIEAYDKFAPELKQFVTLHKGDYKEHFPELIEQAGTVDFFVLDGAEDGQETLDQFHFFDERSHRGTELFAHDWETEKSRLVRPELESSKTWEITEVAGPPKSVGLAVARRVA